MERLYQRVSGADVHRDQVTVAVQAAEPDGRVSSKVSRFTTMGDGLTAMVRWLSVQHVELVAIESTGVYWIPVYDALVDGMDPSVGVWLCNAHHVKNVPGRKTDVADAAWLADVAMHGMVRPSFVPPRHIRDLRGLTRLRTRMVQDRARQVQRLEQVFQQAHLKISSVASRVYLKSTRAMIDALIAGQRDPAVLAELAKGRLRAKRGELERALDTSGFRADHAHAAAGILSILDELDIAIGDLDTVIAERVEPVTRQLELLTTIPGVHTRIAQIIWAETGGDMSQFPSAGHLCAWAGVAPGSHESAGKQHHAPARHGNIALKHALIEAAAALTRSRGTYLADFQRSIAARRGINPARVATAHKILIAAWHILTTDEPYHDLGADHRHQHRNTNRHTRLARELEAAGYTITRPAA